MANLSDESGHEKESLEVRTAELSQLRERIMSDARRRVDPQSKGFSPVMFTDDSSFFNTDDVAFRDWWDWGEQIVRTISDGLTRVALGLTASGLAIAASHMYASSEGTRYAGATLGAAGALVAWLLVSTGSAMRRK